MDGQTELSRDLALRIGLAARALPDTHPKSLLAILTTVVGLPLTEAKFLGIDLPAFKAAAGSPLANLDAATLTRALLILKQPAEQATVQPASQQAYREGAMPNSVRIACASNNGTLVDGHFGSCPKFLVYQVSAQQRMLCDVRPADIPEGLVVPDKNVYRAELIQDCQVVYMASVGGPAAAKIVKWGIHPIKLAEVQRIDTVISQLQTVLAGTPPPWLAKAMGLEPTQRGHFAQGIS